MTPRFGGHLFSDAGCGLNGERSARCSCLVDLVGVALADLAAVAEKMSKTISLRIGGNCFWRPLVGSLRGTGKNEWLSDGVIRFAALIR